MGEGVIPFLFYAEAFRRRKLRCYLLSELLHVALYQFTCNHWLKLLGQVHPSQRTLVFSARCWLQQYARPQLMVAVYYAFGHFGFKLNHALILGRNPPCCTSCLEQTRQECSNVFLLPFRNNQLMKVK